MIARADPQWHRHSGGPRGVGRVRAGARSDEGDDSWLEWGAMVTCGTAVEGEGLVLGDFKGAKVT